MSVIDHVEVFATFVEDGLSISNFLGLLEIANDKKYVEDFFSKVVEICEDMEFGSS